MTNKEAIDVMKNSAWGEFKYTLEETWQAVGVAIEALEKQIPKKPTESYDGYANGYPVIDYSCPNCGHELDDTDHHCICGQTIDWNWSEVD